MSPMSDLSNLISNLKDKQECFTVGCVPPLVDRIPACTVRGVYAQGDVSAQRGVRPGALYGGSLSRGGLPRGSVADTPL